MPRNNCRTRREQRQKSAQARAKKYADAGQSVAQREASRGFPARQERELAAAAHATGAARRKRGRKS